VTRSPLKSTVHLQVTTQTMPRKRWSLRMRILIRVALSMSRRSLCQLSAAQVRLCLRTTRHTIRLQFHLHTQYSWRLTWRGWAQQI
jgi:hypothetical protein